MYHSEVRCIYNKLNPFTNEQNDFSFNSIINDTVIDTITAWVALSGIPW